MSSKIKYSVCHVVYEQFPRDPRVRRFVNAALEEAIYSIIICSKKKNEKYFEELSGIRIYRIPVSKKRGSFLITFLEYVIFTYISINLLIYLGLKYKFKIIHVHTLPDFLVFAALLNKIFGAEIILDMHELFPELFIARTGAAEKSIKVRLLKTVENWAIGFADCVITIHDNARNVFLSRNKCSENKVKVIMNSVDPAEYSNHYAPEKSSVLSRLEDSEFVITYNGTVVKLLNLTLIVEALAHLNKTMSGNDFKKIVFRIYGDGPALDEILSLAKRIGVEDKVEYMGYIQPDEMRREVLKTSVVILPPLKNIYSDLFYTIKLIEAIYLKIPVIATRLKTYARYYTEDSIFYFQSGNVEELCSRIQEVFYNKELVNKKTENAFGEYQKVGWEVMKMRYLNILKSLST